MVSKRARMGSKMPLRNSSALTETIRFRNSGVGACDSRKALAMARISSDAKLFGLDWGERSDSIFLQLIFIPIVDVDQAVLGPSE
jgi:hypothetical protein